MTSNPQMPGCAGTNLINLIYTKLSTFPSSKISRIRMPFPPTQIKSTIVNRKLQHLTLQLNYTHPD